MDLIVILHRFVRNLLVVLCVAIGLSARASGALCIPTGDETVDPPDFEAAFATIDVPALGRIYGEQNFPFGTSIELLFSPIQNKVGLSSVQSREELLSVIGLGTNLSPVVNLIFVDTVDWCGFFSPGIVGCSNSRGNTLVLESEAAASSMGTELLAHELGHLLGLRHVDGPPNLMSGPLNGDTSLTPDQIETINDSPFVQGFDPHRTG